MLVKQNKRSDSLWPFWWSHPTGGLFYCSSKIKQNPLKFSKARVLKGFAHTLMTSTLAKSGLSGNSCILHFDMANNNNMSSCRSPHEALTSMFCWAAALNLPQVHRHLAPIYSLFWIKQDPAWVKLFATFSNSCKLKTYTYFLFCKLNGFTHKKTPFQDSYRKLEV